MSNLDTIVKDIKDNAFQRKEEILDDARMKKERILSQAREQNESNKREALRRAEEDGNFRKERYITTEKIKVRDRILIAKQQAIEEVIDRAVKELESISAEELAKSIERAMEEHPGYELLLPQRYEGSKAFDAWNPVFSEAVRSGFRLEKGHMVLSYDFEELITAKREELGKEVAKTLFSEEV